MIAAKSCQQTNAIGLTCDRKAESSLSGGIRFSACRDKLANQIDDRRSTIDYCWSRVGRSMDYLFHSYPKELAKQIVSKWKADSNVSKTLPPEEVLASLLSEAYQASLLREEDRAVICRLILADPTELSDEVGPPNGLHVLKFREERQMGEEEIRRLSAQPRPFIGA